MVCSLRFFTVHPLPEREVFVQAYTLAEIYGWFIEGFDAKDLQETKARLEELT
jgi:hypothetical protein